MRHAASDEGKKRGEKSSRGDSPLGCCVEKIGKRRRQGYCRLEEMRNEENLRSLSLPRFCCPLSCSARERGEREDRRGKGREGQGTIRRSRREREGLFEERKKSEKSGESVALLRAKFYFFRFRAAAAAGHCLFSSSKASIGFRPFSLFKLYLPPSLFFPLRKQKTKPRARLAWLQIRGGRRGPSLEKSQLKN